MHMQWYGLLEEIVCLVSLLKSSHKSDWDVGFMLAGIIALLNFQKLFTASEQRYFETSRQRASTGTCLSMFLVCQLTLSLTSSSMQKALAYSASMSFMSYQVLFSGMFTGVSLPLFVRGLLLLVPSLICPQIVTTTGIIDWDDLVEISIYCFLILALTDTLQFSFPRTFTNGESFLTSALIILPLRWSFEAQADVIAKTFSGVGVIISAGWAALIVTVLIVACATLTKKERNSSPKLTQADCHLATVFYGGVFAFCLFTPLIGIILDYENPVMTVLYALGRLCDLPHFLMLTVWFGLTILTAKVLEKHKKSKAIQFSTAERKIFHGIAVCSIMAGIACDPELLALVTFAILIIFIWTALYSGYQVYPYGNQIRRLLVTMTDHRDQGKIIATPIYLLFGVSFPIWCDLMKFGKITNSALAGIASIGIGDSFAALVGVKYGKTRIFGEKTLEGCVANYASQVVFYLSLWLIAPQSFVFSVDLIISLFLTSLLEAVTDQIDNLVLPVFLYSCLAL